MATKLEIEILTDISDTLKDIKKFQDSTVKATKKVSDELERTEREAKSLGATFRRVGETATAFLASKVITSGFNALINSFKGSIEAANRQEDAINSLNVALATSGQYSQAASKDMQAFASQIQDTTRFGDEAVLEALSLAKAFGANNDQAKLATRAAVEYAAATRKSLPEAIRQVSKTLGGFAGELGEVNPKIKGLTKEQLKAGAAAQVLIEQYGGTAAAQVNTFSGAVDQLSNAFGDLLEAFGFLVTKNKGIVGLIQDTTRVIKALGDTVKANAETIRTAFRVATIAVEVFFAALLVNKVIRFVTVVQQLALVFGGLRVVILATAASLKSALITTGIGAAIVGIGYLIDKFLDLKESAGGFGKAFRVIGLTIKKLFLELQVAINGLKKGILDLIAKIPGAGGAAKNAIGLLADDNKELEKSIADINVEIAKMTKGLKQAGDSGEKALNQLNNSAKELKRQNLSKELAQTISSGGFGAIAQGVKDKSFKNTNANSAAAIGLGALSDITKGAEGAAKAVGGVLGVIGDSLLPGIGGAVAALTEFLAQGPEKVKETINAFFEALPDVIASIIESLPVLIESLSEGLALLPQVLLERMPEIIQHFIQGLVEAAPRVITSMVLQTPRMIAAVIQNVPKIVSSFITEFVKGVPRIIDELIKQLVEGIGDVFGGIGSGIGDVASGAGDIFSDIGGFLGFQHGGEVPNMSRFQNDAAIVRASAGEYILDRSLTEDLKGYLANQRGGGAGQNLTVNVQVGEETLASTLLNINRQGFRTA